MRKNNEILLVIVLAAVFASAFYSRSMREKDVQRLTPLAEAGNEKAMQNLMLYGDTIVPLDVREHYMQLLAENGNPEGLYAIVEPSRLRFQDMPFYDYTPENVKWLNHGAEKGDPYCLYMLSGYYDKKGHRDTVLSDSLMLRAADSGYAKARLYMFRQNHKGNILARPCFVFSQVWNGAARDYALFPRFSNALFHFSIDFFGNCFKSLFTSRWWQSLLGIVFMIALFVIGGMYLLCLKKEEKASAMVSGVYGWLNCFILLYQYVGRGGDGFLRATDTIFRFTHQPEAFSTLSYISVWATWIWTLTFVFCLVLAIIDRMDKGLGAKGWILFVLRFLLSNLLAYFLFASIAMFSRILAFILGLVVAGYFLVGNRNVSDKLGWADDLAKYGERLKKESDDYHKRMKEEEDRKEFRRRVTGHD